MRVSVCFSFQNSHTQSMTEILKKGLSRNFQKLVKHTTSLTFPPSKKQHFVGKIFLSNLIFSVAFLSIIFIPAKCRRRKTIWNMRHTSSQLQDLCSAPPLLQMFDVRKITLGAPHLSFLTATWELHFMLSRKWWEDKSVRDCFGVEMNVRQICKLEASRFLSVDFFQTHIWQTNITSTTPREETQVLISEWVFKLMWKFRMKAVAWQ